jgi:RNA polymerase subunit RPABC4/transcription elongation factor Spt4
MSDGVTTKSCENCQRIFPKGWWQSERQDAVKGNAPFETFRYCPFCGKSLATPAAPLAPVLSENEQIANEHGIDLPTLADPPAPPVGKRCTKCELYNPVTHKLRDRAGLWHWYEGKGRWKGDYWCGPVVAQEDKP